MSLVNAWFIQVRDSDLLISRLISIFYFIVAYYLLRDNHLGGTAAMFLRTAKQLLYGPLSASFIVPYE